MKDVEKKSLQDVNIRIRLKQLMNDMPWDNVICDARVEEVTAKGDKVFIKCEGVMLPVDRYVFNNGYIATSVVYTIWICHKCGKEVK